jgi:hypothetical protein
VHDEPPDSPPGVDGSTPPVTPAPTTAPLPNQPPTEPDPDATGEAATNPAWANDLRKLYNAVVEEPLPDSFIALLSQLDADD